jgi:hypothetical protein
MGGMSDEETKGELHEFGGSVGGTKVTTDLGPRVVDTHAMYRYLH